MQLILYTEKKITSQVRLLHGQTVLEDERKLSEYSLPEGTTISALLQPDVDINIEVSTGVQTQRLTVSNATSTMALKVEICGVMRCGVVPERLELRLGDVTLENPMPLHFYGLQDGSQVKVIKPFISVIIRNGKMGAIYWRLYQKETIREVKVKLAASLSALKFELCYNTYKSDSNNFNEIRGINDPCVADELRLYKVSKGDIYEELDDDETIENLKLKDDDQLYSLTYQWSPGKFQAIIDTTRRNVHGVQQEDTVLDIKLRAQDQTGHPVSKLQLPYRDDAQFFVLHPYQTCVSISF